MTETILDTSMFSITQSVGDSVVWLKLVFNKTGECLLSSAFETYPMEIATREFVKRRFYHICKLINSAKTELSILDTLCSVHLVETLPKSNEE